MSLPIARTELAASPLCPDAPRGIGSAENGVGDGAASCELKAPSVASGDDLKVCARCRHWIPVYSTPVDDWEEPGGCFGMTGKWTRWNGMWTKASDGCENWQLSPLRANIQLHFPVDESVEAMRIDATPDDLIPF